MYYVRVYGNNDCFYCRKTYELINYLRVKGCGLDFNYKGLSKELKEGIMNHYNVDITTIPQILVDQEYIGGYTEFVNWCNKEFPFIMDEWNKKSQEEWNIAEIIAELNDMDF